MNTDKEQFNEVDDILRQYLNDIEIEPSADFFDKVRKRKRSLFLLFRNKFLLMTFSILIFTLSVYLSFSNTGFLGGSSEQTADISSQNNEEEDQGNPYAMNEGSNKQVPDMPVNVEGTTPAVKEDENTEMGRPVHSKLNDHRLISGNDLSSVEGDYIIKDKKNVSYPSAIFSGNFDEISFVSSTIPGGSDPSSDFLQNSPANRPLLKKMPLKQPFIRINAGDDDPVLVKKKISIQQKRISWFAEIYHELSYNDYFINSGNEEVSSATNKSTILKGSYNTANAGFLIGFSKNNSSLKAGLSFVTLNEDYTDHNLPAEPEPGFQAVYNGTPWTFANNDQYFFVDSSDGYYHYVYIQDSVTHIVDSVWDNLYDTSLVNIFDTVQVQIGRTMQYRKNDFRYRLFEFPLIYSYEYSFGNYGINFGGGIVPGLLSCTPLYFYNGDHFEIQEQSVRYNRFVISATCMLGMRYFLHERANIFFNLGYKKGLSSLYERSSGISQKSSSVFLQYGICLTIK